VDLRGPTASSNSPVASNIAASSKQSRFRKRDIFSASLTRSNTAGTHEVKVTGSGDIPGHEFETVKCKAPDVHRRTTVSSQMEVCKECQKWIREMRFLVQRYDKTGCVKGTRAFEEFLRFGAEEDIS
jgi:hypothetical protein